LRIAVLDKQLYDAELEDGFAPVQPGDAGIDLRAAEGVDVGYRQTATIPLGVAIEIAEDQVGWLTGRSSSTLSFGLLFREGKIDSGYRGEIHAIVTALERSCHITRGERIAQLVILRIVPPGGVGKFGWEAVEELGRTVRGKHGLGSTGRI